MSALRNLRLQLKKLRRIIFGFVSVTTFSYTRIENFPFADEDYALENDKSEIYSDREIANKKLKQNDRTQSS